MGVSTKLEWDVIQQAATSRLPIGVGVGEIPAIKFDKLDGYGLRVDIAGAPAYSGVPNPHPGPGPALLANHTYARDFVGGDSLTQSVEAFFRYEFGAGVTDQAASTSLLLRGKFVPGDVDGYQLLINHLQTGAVKAITLQFIRYVANVGTNIIVQTVFPGASPGDNIGIRMSVRNSGVADVDYKIDLSVDGGQNWSNFADSVDVGSPLFGSASAKFNFAVSAGTGHNYEAGQYMDLDQIRFLNTYDVF